MVFNRIQIVKQQGLFGLNSSREINFLMPRFFCQGFCQREMAEGEN